MTLPIVVDKSGLQPRSPATLLAALLQIVASEVPGYTSNLPGSLIEDVSSTDVAALAICDAAAVELVNSLTPYGANAFLLTQLGQLYGVDQGAASNTSVLVQFSGPPGFVIAEGFTVSDGVYQYNVQDGGIIGSGGVSSNLSAVATIPGTWDIPSGTVNEIVTSVPSSVALTVVNPLPGTPGGEAESEESYRAAVLTAGQATATGMASLLKTLLGNIPGVQRRLISVRQQTAGWEVLVGGSGDPYQIAYQIYRCLFALPLLVGSQLSMAGATKANPGVITTNINHNYETGQTVTFSNVLGMTQLNGNTYTITVLSEKTFSIGVNTTSFGTYTGGGTLSPLLSNVVVSINDYPDTYNVVYVAPPEQTVTMTLVWNTNSPNFVSGAAIAQLGGPALVDYINSLPVGVPINVFEMNTVFQEAVSSILDPQLLTRIVFTVSINGVGTPPDAGTGVIDGDPESYFLTDISKINITQS